MELRNVSRYYPEDMPYGEGIQYFCSEDGQDFYDSVNKFTKKYKLCIHPDTGVIYSMAEDASRLYPAGFSIVEVDELPEGFCIEARWYYRDGEILPVPVDYRQQAETLRNRLLSEARSITSDWQTELSLGIISDDDRLKLTQWMMYIRELNSLNISDIDNKDNFEAINWPAVPETK
ncbi:tail fiber assembly protein [Escherichia coli]|uniref:tail fiber assembly protein n=1 Tax=Escherichia coli TaxID=562 RepID=UPI0038B2F237|nr:tail fiber assembly protein [Escherichia coli]